MTPIEHIASFLSLYKQTMSENQSGLAKHQLNSFAQLFSQYRFFKPQLEEVNQTEAEYFNIFGILKLHYSEVRVHTPIIANLLNPKGSHAQGDLFFKRFIEIVLDQDASFSFYEADKMYVKDELSTAYGQIDIFIEHRAAKNPFALIIENKINARDQKDQLVRYGKYLDTLGHIEPSAKRMLYLKPMHASPGEYSVDSITLHQWVSSGFLKIISYKVEIIDWLSICLDKIKAPKVRIITEQYLQTLKMICS